MCRNIKKLADIEIRETIARVAHDLLEVDRALATTDDMSASMQFKAKKRELELLITELHERLADKEA